MVDVRHALDLADAGLVELDALRMPMKLRRR
jgi:hypothetical protein